MQPGAGATSAAGTQECACGIKLMMRVCQQGPNRGRSYWACANRADACRHCFLWSDGRKNLADAKPSASAAGSGDGGALSVFEPAVGRGASMLQRLQKRAREAAIGQDMTAEGVAARELSAALQAGSATIRSKTGSSGSSKHL